MRNVLDLLTYDSYGEMTFYSGSQVEVIVVHSCR